MAYANWVLFTQSTALSAVIFDAQIIVALIPLTLRGLRYTPSVLASQLLEVGYCDDRWNPPTMNWRGRP